MSPRTFLIDGAEEALFEFIDILAFIYIKKLGKRSILPFSSGVYGGFGSNIISV